jgi:catechol 2,3-dioxygenase-like lactoylglutathione lyase family enzyme
MSQSTTDSATGIRVPSLHALHHIGLTVSDVERSEAWYAAVFGFERMMVEPHRGGTGFAVVMNRPGTPLFIGLDSHSANEGEAFGEHRTGLDHLAISVSEREHLDEWVDYLDSIGVAHGGINDISEPFPFATLVVRDPDNIQLELTWMA